MMIDTTTKSGSPHKNKNKPLSEEEVKKGHCNHGPNAKCINCLGVSKHSMKDSKVPCNHPPLQKCPKCISNEDDKRIVKHESFEHYLSAIKAKCRGKHKAD